MILSRKEIGGLERSNFARSHGLLTKDQKARMKVLEGKTKLSKKEKRELDLLQKVQNKRFSVGDYADTLQQFALLTTLYLKPAYFGPNFAGQLMILAADHAWNPFSISKTGMLTHATWAKYRKVPIKIGKKKFSEYDLMRSRIRAAMGNGMANSLAGMSGHHPLGRSINLARAVKNIQVGYGAFLDSPFRDNAFYHAAQRTGFGTPEAIHDLVLNPDLRGKFYEVSQRANANAIDFTMAWKHDPWFRRTIFFYSWIKGSSKWTARMSTEHPYQFQLGYREGQNLKEQILKEFGAIPEYLDGSIIVGHRLDPLLGRIPLIINPASISITGSLGDAIKSGGALISGHAAQSEMPADWLSPPLSAGIAMITGTDPFTGKTYPTGTSPFEIFLKKMLGNVAGVQSYQRFKQAGESRFDTTNKLFPFTTHDVRMKTLLGGAAKTPVNPKIARSRGVADLAAGATRGERLELKTGPALDEFKAAYKAAYKTPVPKELVQYASRNLLFQLNRAAWRDRSKNFGPYEKLLADANFMIASKQWTEQEARDWLKQYAGAVPSVQAKASSTIARTANGYGYILNKYVTIINKYREQQGDQPISEFPKG